MKLGTLFKLNLFNEGPCVHILKRERKGLAFNKYALLKAFLLPECMHLYYKGLHYSVVGIRNWLCILSSLPSFWGVAGWMIGFFCQTRLLK